MFLILFGWPIYIFFFCNRYKPSFSTDALRMVPGRYCIKLNDQLQLFNFLFSFLFKVTKTRNGGRLCIVYRAPCGRRMRNMDEVHRYLRLTVSDLGVDLFCFDSFVHCFAEFEPSVVYSTIKGKTFYHILRISLSCILFFKETMSPLTATILLSSS